MSLFSRLFLILLVLALAPVLAATFWFSRSGVRAEENAKHLHALVADGAAALAADAVGEMNGALGFVAVLERGAGPDDELRAVQSAAIAHPRLAYVALYSDSGRERARLADPAVFGPGESLWSRPGTAAAVAERRLSAPEVFEKAGRPLVLLVHPLSRGGAAVAAYDVSALWQRLRNLGSEERGSSVVLTGADGRPMPGFKQAAGGPRAEDLAAAARGAFDEGGVLGAWRAVPGVGWRLVSTQPSERARLTERDYAQAGTGFAVVMALLVGAVALLLAQALSAPLQALVRGAEGASSQRFDRLVPETGWPEMRQVARAFNEMARKMAQYSQLQVERQLDDKARLDALVSAMRDGIALVGLDGRFLFVNDAAVAVLGADVERLVGLTVDEAFQDPHARDAFLGILARAQSGEAAEQTVFNNEGGRVGLFEFIAKTVKRGEQTLGVLVAMRDVTLERELEKTKKTIFENITHDLRAPLSSVSGYVQMLIDGFFGPVNAVQTEKLRVVEHAVSQLAELINTMLDVSKFEAGMMVLEPAPGRLSDVVTSAVELSQGLAQGLSVSLRLAVEADLPESRFDAVQVRRLVLNLLSNALKFTPAGGSVTVGARPWQEGGIVVSVADTGAGIPKDKLPSLFTKFFQVAETKSKARRGGTGLGLTICRQIVEAHGGKIWAESEWEKGSVFSFRLP
ncbi:MAG: PAS domain S-box protein [Elusimicrobia bacterium]|nr:PAS domain S-box protein [Elusimicrobiota bacterium]